MGDKKALDPIVEEAIKDYPDYVRGKMLFAGTKEYWRGVFETETNRDPKLHEDFSKLHHDIVDMVIKFCKDHDLDVEEFSVHADGLLNSKEFGKWTCSTDSSMSMYVPVYDEEAKTSWVDRDGDPFLFEI